MEDCPKLSEKDAQDTAESIMDFIEKSYCVNTPRHAIVSFLALNLQTTFTQGCIKQIDYKRRAIQRIFPG